MNKEKKHTAFERYLLSLGRSSRTIEAYQWSVEKFEEWLTIDGTRMDEVNSSVIVSYLSYLQKQGVSNSTRNLRMMALNQYFNYQIEKGDRMDHPSKHLKVKGLARNKLYSVLSSEQLDSLYHGYTVPLEDDPNNKYNWFRPNYLGRRRNKAILGLMIYQGLTTAEITHLQLSDIRLRQGVVFVKGGIKGADRTLELKSWQVMDLMEYQLQIRPEIMSHHQQATSIYFLSMPSGMDTKVKSYNLYIWQFIKNDLRKLQPSFSNFQQLRASVIVHWLSQYNIRVVQQMAGHSSVASTERYLAYKVEDLQEDIDKFHPMG